MKSNEKFSRSLRNKLLALEGISQVLLQFVVQNYKSIRDETILNLAPDRKERIHTNHIINCEEGSLSCDALPLALLYGANGSGKSNLIQAIAFAQEFILNGTRANRPIHTIPYKLDKNSAKKPSRFEFVIKKNGIIYQYGFLANSSIVLEEWLFGDYGKGEERVFERITNEDISSVESGTRLAATQEEKQYIEFVAKGTRPNQLFLTESILRNVQHLKPLMSWFETQLKVIWPNAIYQSLLKRVHGDKNFSEFLGTFLRLADTGVTGVEFVKQRIDVESLMTKIPETSHEEFREMLSSNDESEYVFGIKDFFATVKKEPEGTVILSSLHTKHNLPDGKSVNFETIDESDGTRRLMHLAPALFDMHAQDSVYIIDELDRSMHPLLSKFYVDAFLDGVTGSHLKGQLIFSTHEDYLLDLKTLRRDEIWFVEKDEHGATHLASLSDYQVRKDLKISKGYLLGRFGAIPFLGDPKKLKLGKVVK